MKPRRYARDGFEGSAVRGALALILAWLLPFAAHAANEGEIRSYIIAINRHYENLDYEFALSRIQLARQLPRGTDEEVALSLYEGIILCEMGKQGPGSSAFRAALLLRPDAKLPVQVSPKLETLFESARKQVKQELESRLLPRAMESPSNKSEQKQEVLTAPPAVAPVEEKREETRLAQFPEKAAPSSVEPRTSTALVAETEVKAVPTPPAPNSPKGEQKVAPDCGPKPVKPVPVPSPLAKTYQSWRLANMKHELCLKDRFQGLAIERWVDLMVRMEDVTTSNERALISWDLDQFTHDFIYKDALEAARLEAARLEAARLEAARLEAARLESLRLEAERREAAHREALRLEAARREALRTLLEAKARDGANLDTSGCQPVASAGCELLLQRLRSIQAAFLTKPPSNIDPLRELSKIGQEIRATRTSEELQQAAQALDSWLQRQLAQ